MLRKINIKKSSRKSNNRSPWIVRWRSFDGSQPSRAFPTKTLATEFAKNIWGTLNSDDFQQIVPVPWTEISALFLAAKTAEQKAENTIVHYTRILRDFGRSTGEPQSNKITARHVDLYKTTLAGRSPFTINKKLRHLSAFFAWAVSRNYMAKNPIASSDKLREPKRLPHAITPDELTAILRAIDIVYPPPSLYGREWRLLLLLGLNGVARKSSIAAMTVKDVDVETETVKVYDEKPKEWRVTPLHPAIMKVLIKHLNDMPAKQVNLFTGKCNNSAWQKIIKVSGIPYITFHHATRTGLTSWLKMAGVSSSVASRVLGHSSTAVTEKYYTDLSGVEIKREAINKLPLDDIIGG